jgi:ABC-type transport system involved in multi-copper enzyme maturation permease subunit
VELRKVVNTVTGRRLFALLSILIVGALGITVASNLGQGLALHSLMSNALVPVGLLVPIVGVLIMSGEFSTRTILVTLTLVPSRSRVVAAKALAALVVAMAVAVLTGFLAVLAGAGASLSGESVRWTVEPAVIIQLLMLQVINVLVGVGFGLLFQSTPVGVMAFVIVPLLIGFVVFAVPSLREIAPWLELSTGTTPLSRDTVANAREWLQTASVSGIWIGLPAALGWLRLRRREVV